MTCFLSFAPWRYLRKFLSHQKRIMNSSLSKIIQEIKDAQMTSTISNDLLNTSSGETLSCLTIWKSFTRQSCSFFSVNMQTKQSISTTRKKPNVIAELTLSNTILHFKGSTYKLRRWINNQWHMKINEIARKNQKLTIHNFHISEQGFHSLISFWVWNQHFSHQQPLK